MRIGDIAQGIMDLYYQDYATDENFFTLDDFVSQVKTEYTKLIIDDYQADKLLNNQIDGFSYITVPVDLLRFKEYEVKEDCGIKYVQLDAPVFIYPFDSMASGVQSVQRISGKMITQDYFVKISVNDTWKVQYIKHGSRSYFSVLYDRIVFEKLGCGDIKNVRIGYVPQISSMTENDEISDSRADVIETGVLQKMFAARNGVVIDKGNNSNPNVALQTEMDSNQMKK